MSTTSTRKNNSKILTGLEMISVLHAVTTLATSPMQWLEDEFLGYLQNLEGSVMAQSGLSMKEKNSMLP